jgi:hypothetical protein
MEPDSNSDPKSDPNQDFELVSELVPDSELSHDNQCSKSLRIAKIRVIYLSAELSKIEIQLTPFYIVRAPV